MLRAAGPRAACCARRLGPLPSAHLGAPPGANRFPFQSPWRGALQRRRQAGTEREWRLQSRAAVARRGACIERSAGESEVAALSQASAA